MSKAWDKTVPTNLFIEDWNNWNIMGNNKGYYLNMRRIVDGGSLYIETRIHPLTKERIYEFRFFDGIVWESKLVGHMLYNAPRGRKTNGRCVGLKAYNLYLKACKDLGMIV